jgi:hypothetical protein
VANICSVYITNASGDSLLQNFRLFAAGGNQVQQHPNVSSHRQPQFTQNSASRNTGAQSQIQSQGTADVQVVRFGGRCLSRKYGLESSAFVEYGSLGKTVVEQWNSGTERGA